MKYYLQKNEHGKHIHELHSGDCPTIQNCDNYICVGDFMNSTLAMKAAKELCGDWKVDGCGVCIPEFNKK